MSEPQQYYLLAWDTASTTDDYITIYGPYDTVVKCASDGRMWQMNNNDSPCWQVLKGPLDIKLRPQFNTL